MRVKSLPASDILSNKKIKFLFNDLMYEGLEGESIAAALLANGVRTLRFSEKSGEPRGLYCGIGHCYECRVHLEGTGDIRACVTPVQEGMNLRFGGRGGLRGD
ncbi:MAG: (2Fe-2S)-binding protein [Paenibacillaceae bacterium]